MTAPIISIKLTLSSILLKWYDVNVHPYPWRLTKDPYRVWLSEVMLQQTRVNVVIPYYSNWLNEMPNLNSVARSNVEYLLKKWEGMGYYYRVRNFYSSSKIIVGQLDSIIPNDFINFHFSLVNRR